MECAADGWSDLSTLIRAARDFAEKDANFAAEVAALQAPGSSTEEPGDDTATLPSRATELNAIALGWAVFKDWLLGLFGKKKA